MKCSGDLKTDFPDSVLQYFQNKRREWEDLKHQTANLILYPHGAATTTISRQLVGDITDENCGCNQEREGGEEGEQCSRN